MKKLNGKKWGEISKEKQQELLNNSYIDNDNVDIINGDCLIDFEENITISGNKAIVNDEIVITIEDEAIFYNSLGE